MPEPYRRSKARPNARCKIVVQAAKGKTLRRRGTPSNIVLHTLKGVVGIQVERPTFLKAFDGVNEMLITRADAFMIKPISGAQQTLAHWTQTLVGLLIKGHAVTPT